MDHDDEYETMDVSSAQALGIAMILACIMVLFFFGIVAVLDWFA